MIPVFQYRRWCRRGDRSGKLFFMATGGMMKRNQLYCRKNDATLQMLGEN